MIRYAITPAQLRARIEAHKPGWLERARQRTDGFRAAGGYQESSSIWSEVKRVYMDLQNSKCAYCERQLEKNEPVEHDLEHYRPKKNVRVWPADHHGVVYDFATGPDFPGGYFLLAYAPRNYCAACKPCNTSFKNDYFPIAGARGNQTAERPADLTDEKPFVIYPIGGLDPDPETLLGFEGIVPKPLGTRGHKRRRAVVTIDFLNLDGRETLRVERARTIEKLAVALRLLEMAPGDPLAQGIIDRAQLPSSPHTSCAKAFVKLFGENRGAADLVVEGVLQYLASDPLGTR